MATDTIAFSKAKLLKITLFALLFIAIGIWLLCSDLTTYFPDQEGAIVKSVLGWAAVLLGAMGLFSTLKCSLSKDPGFVIDEIGILDNSSAFPKGRLLWEDIQIAEELVVRIRFFVKQRYVRILLKNGKAKTISATVLEVSNRELRDKINDGLMAWRAKH